METARAAQAIIPQVVPPDDNTRWFSGNGCVVWKPYAKEVLVDGTLISSFGSREVEVRNLTLVGLAMEPKIKKGKLAKAFGISAELLRLLRKEYEAHGIDGIRPAPRRGPKGKVTPALRKEFIELFEEDGMNAHQAFVELGEKAGVCYRVVCRIRHAWEADRGAMSAQVSGGQLELEGVEDAAVDCETSEPELEPAEPRPSNAAAVCDVEMVAEGQAPRSSRHVRHAGCWLLVSMVHAFGLHAALLRHWKTGRRWREQLRVVVDAVIMALGIGQRCVEGVRRLEASSGGVLLRAKRVPSESWTRRVLKTYVESGCVPYVHLAMTQSYLELAAARSRGVTVFYVDNHLRPYTGKHTIRKGWRMQDKRVLPGVTDYYVHDEDGRPVYRLDVPSHDTLTAWLTPVAQVLRAALGESERVLLAFDRAGAFPEQLVELRDHDFEFVTYERRPYQSLAAAAFSESVTVDGETYGIHESQLANLGKGRGRVRRIAVLTPEGHQINLLAVSKEKKERLFEVMLGRWVQDYAERRIMPRPVVPSTIGIW